MKRYSEILKLYDYVSYLISSWKRNFTKIKLWLIKSDWTSKMQMIDQVIEMIIRSWFLSWTKPILIQLSVQCMSFLSFLLNNCWVTELLLLNDESECFKISSIELSDGLICWMMISFVSSLKSINKQKLISLSYQRQMLMMKRRKKNFKNQFCRILQKSKKKFAIILKEWNNQKSIDIELLRSFQHTILMKIQRYHKISV